MKHWIGGLALCALALCTNRHVPTWQSEATVWNQAFRVAPNKPRVLVNLAAVAIGGGQWESAEKWLDAAELSRLTRSGWENGHTKDLVLANRAVIRLQTGHYDEAMLLIHKDGTGWEGSAREGLCVRYHC